MIDERLIQYRDFLVKNFYEEDELAKRFRNEVSTTSSSAAQRGVGYKISIDKLYELFPELGDNPIPKPKMTKLKDL